MIGSLGVAPLITPYIIAINPAAATTNFNLDMGR